MRMIEIPLRTDSLEDYATFLRVKTLPTYRIRGRSAFVPEEYLDRIGLGDRRETPDHDYTPSEYLFDYQRDIARIAIEKRKYAVFADCGLGKTAIIGEFARHAAATGRLVLIVSPLMVVPQTVEEFGRFYPDMEIEVVKAAKLTEWLRTTTSGIGITNYDALRDDVQQGNLGALILDESSMLKSHYGKYARKCIELGTALDYKLCCTGTPAPNDRIEYGNHAVFLDAFRTTNEFLARYFVNRGKTSERWQIKPHALRPFYRDISHWCVFLSNPAVYGWSDNVESIPPIHVHIEHVESTADQISRVQSLTGSLFAKNAGGVGERSKLSQIAKGAGGIATNKPEFIRSRVESWPSESTIIWCLYNDEQRTMERVFPDAVSITGSTKYSDRIERIDAFKSGRAKVLITKPKILGFGLNLQVATRMVFSGLQDSYEQYYQAVKRSNRIGSTRPLNVHIPVTDVEVPMINTVLAKADRVQRDTEEQELLFRESSRYSGSV